MTAIDRTSVRIAEAADRIRDFSNAVGLPHAMQGRTYGHAADLVVEALTVGLEVTNNIPDWNARAIADEIYDTMLDCGEGVEYVLDYHGIEIVEGDPLPGWAVLP